MNLWIATRLVDALVEDLYLLLKVGHGEGEIVEAFKWASESQAESRVMRREFN
jgi:hypothetical protein